MWAKVMSDTELGFGGKKKGKEGVATRNLRKKRPTKGEKGKDGILSARGCAGEHPRIEGDS